MAEATTTEEVEYADYYQVTAGYTVGVHVCSEGEIIAGDAMGLSGSNPPLTEEEQEEKYGRVLYTEYEPDESEIEQLRLDAGKIIVGLGMHSPDEPALLPAAGPTEQPLDMLGRPELQKKAKSLGLNFPDDTDREQMIGAIEKKQAKAAAATPAAKSSPSKAVPEEEEER